MSAERINPTEIKTQEEYLLYLKEVFIYSWCAEKIPRNCRCLDIGCGEGYGAKLLSSSAKETVGIDIDKNTIAKALKKYADRKCAYMPYNGANIPFPDNYFDAAVSFHSIEHIKNDSGVVDEAYRVLKNNGVFIITTPNKAIRLPGNMPSWNVFHVREYNPSELKQLLAKRFTEIQILGIDAREKEKSIEVERIKKNLKIASFDFLNLRRVFPPAFVSFFIKMFRSLNDSGSHPAFNLLNDAYKNPDVYRITRDPENALDILGICAKLS